MKLWPFSRRETKEDKPAGEAVRTSPLLNAMRAEILSEIEPLLFEMEANLMRLEIALEQNLDPFEIKREISRAFTMGRNVTYVHARLLASDLARMPQGAPLLRAVMEIKDRIDELCRLSD